MQTVQFSDLPFTVFFTSGLMSTVLKLAAILGLLVCIQNTNKGKLLVNFRSEDNNWNTQDIKWHPEC